MSIRPFRIDLGYDGTDFAGSQRQPGQRTVQAVVEQALEQLSGQPIRIALAGRTDRGVHAVGQVASGWINWERSADDLARALQAVTPEDVAIYGARAVDAAFHARFSACYREYRYRITTGSRPPLLLRRVTWHVRRPLDLERMAAATRSLIGHRDFAAVAGKGAGVPGSPVNTVRTVSVAGWRGIPNPVERSGRILELQIGGDAFLPHMVRNIVGDLVAIGLGQFPPEWMDELLQNGDRRQGVAPAPPQGLVLWQVRYPDEEDNPDGTINIHRDHHVGVEDDEDVLTKGI
ncbi:tRNA pseudouridine(38-40) synthase TruA [Nitrolancea hollandica]|uniref:tRNA pseudouridine synthase A n=1 Tax=Nitrolancea hollandica Lb TaxID=1129897 RepID=I4EJ07_9BACT|nr:tRNA pseudouridine(38-40) synthase TruA [Nitrolancea hollandica]CCF84669.1 Pseudouridylate synthase [Nitrolancea hollandica Lb]